MRGVLGLNSGERLSDPMPRPAAVATEYSKLSVPRELFENLTRLVEALPEKGYRSASDAATDAIRRLADQLRGELAARKKK